MKILFTNLIKNYIPIELRFPTDEDSDLYWLSRNFKRPIRFSAVNKLIDPSGCLNEQYTVSRLVASLLVLVPVTRLTT